MDEQSDPCADNAGQHAPRARKHMGVATSDPEYLPPAQDGGNRTTGRGAKTTPGSHPGPAGRHAHSNRSFDSNRNANPLHYDRYLSTPQRGRAIFSAQRTRQRRRTAMVILAILLIAVACVAAAYFLLR